MPGCPPWNTAADGSASKLGDPSALGRLFSCRSQHFASWSLDVLGRDPANVVNDALQRPFFDRFDRSERIGDAALFVGEAWNIRQYELYRLFCLGKRL